MKKIFLSSEGMLGVHYHAKPEDVLKVVDKQLQEQGFEIVMFARNDEVMWRLEKSKVPAILKTKDRVHKSGATIRSVSDGG